MRFLGWEGHCFGFLILKVHGLEGVGGSSKDFGSYEGFWVRGCDLDGLGIVCGFWAYSPP